MKSNQKIALFIDCENVSSEYIDTIISELASYGEIMLKKAYGNWESNVLKGWKEKRFDYALESINQPPYSTKKNATDIKMTVDVMRILCQNRDNIDYVALATSDSDFTPLVSEIKSQGIHIIGFGEDKTNKILQNSCNEFIVLTKNKQKDLSKDIELIKLLKNAVFYCSNDNGFARVADVGTYIKNKSSQQAKNFGNYKTWGDIFKALTKIFDISYQDNKHDTMLVKLGEK